jgi:hypothetical protein
MFKKYLYSLIVLACAASVLFSCSEETSPAREADAFTSVFDDNRFNAAYSPIDVQQTPDGGYIILGELQTDSATYSGTVIYLLKADKFGNYVHHVELADSLESPVNRLMTIGSKYYFFCRNSGFKGATLVEMDADIASVTTYAVNGQTYPAAAALVNDHFVMVGYNNEDLETTIAEVSATGTTIRSKGYSIGVGEGVEIPVMNHYLRTGRQLPFDVGQVPNGSYFFNGFYNYTFSLVFTNFGDDPTGVYQGQHDGGGVSAITPLGGANFAISLFNYGDNYLAPRKPLVTNQIQSSVELGGYALPELVPNTKVRILRTTINDKAVVIYGSDTKAKQIGLYFYDEASGLLLGSRYLGFSNPFEIANLIATEDGGLVVCGTTYLAGRFPRICLFKLSKDDLGSEL